MMGQVDEQVDEQVSEWAAEREVKREVKQVALFAVDVHPMRPQLLNKRGNLRISSGRLFHSTKA